MGKYGIDVSSYQGTIDWKKVKAAGIDFAILKVIRKDLNPDKQFEANWSGCVDAGMLVHGVYNYSYANTIEKAKSDAQIVLEVLSGRKARVYLDVEDNCLKGLGSKLISIINTYASVIIGAGLEFGVYTGSSFYNSYIKPYGGLTCPLWIANYGPNNGMMNTKPNIPNINMVGWQFTSRAIVDGVNGYVDKSIWYDELDKSEEVKSEMIKPVDYKQTDSKWGSLSYAVDGESSTIKSAGCGPTAMADVLAAIVSPYIDPVTCASWARMKGYKVYNSGTSYSYPVAQAAEYGVTVRRLNTSNVYGMPSHTLHDEVLKELQKGNWIIACMGKGNWTSSGHYIVCYGYKDGYVYINDPASSKASRLCNTWYLFKSQVKYYWVVEVPEHIKQNGIVSDGDYRTNDFYREVQMCIKAGIDEKPGNQTLSKTVTVSAKKNRTHAVVLPLQKLFRKIGYYMDKLDKIAGKNFTAAVNQYQKDVMNYPEQDGEITAKRNMWKKLLGMI